VRFNDVHKLVAATLKMDDGQAREWRPFMLRCYCRGLSANATLALVRVELAKKSAEAEGAAAVT
jgi:hypothetical protein